MILVFIVTHGFASDIVHGYYITNSNDTIKTNFEITDLFKAHRELVTIDSLGNKKVFKPTDIKGFYYISSTYPDWTTDIESIDHSIDKSLLDKGYLYKKATFSLESEINASSFLADTIWSYNSYQIDANTWAFLLVKYGYGDNLQACVYYTKLDPGKPYLFSPIWFLVKDNQIVNRNNQSLADWTSNTISDYPVLASMIKEKKIKAFPWDFELVVKDYNSWIKINPSERPDSSMTIKGFVDAEKHYHPIAPFTISCVGGTAFFLPGMVSAVIIAHNPKESKIKVPDYLKNKDNVDYKKAYKHKAYSKKYKSAAHGAVTGLGVFLAGLIVVSCL
jgi:hypothetical protein